MNYIIRGKYNEILSDDIGKGTILSGWTFIGKNVKIGKDCRFGNRVTINDNAVIGDRVNIQDGTIITSHGKVGNDVFIGANVMFVDEKYPSPVHDSKKKSPIVVGDNVLIGTNVNIVCCIIGSGAVIGVGSTVMKHVPNYEVWAGTPAKQIIIDGVPLTRKEFDEKMNRQ